MNIRILIPAAVAALAVAGCSGSKTSYTPVAPKATAPAAVPAGEEATLMPFAEGNNWRYDMQGKALTGAGAVPQRAEYSLEVKKVETIPDGMRATIEISRGEVLQDRQIWRLDKSGVYQEQAGIDTPVKLEPPQPLLPFPLDLEKPTNWQGKAPGPAFKPTDMSLEIYNKGPENVDTIVGTFSAYRVEGTQKFKDPKGKEVVTKLVTWWAPKVGLIRQKQDVKVGDITVSSQVMVLRQYTVK